MKQEGCCGHQLHLPSPDCRQGSGRTDNTLMTSVLWKAGTDSALINEWPVAGMA
ncbi:rCG41556, partial [Rattus norvegicus]